MDQFEINAAQFQKLLSAVNSLRDHAPFWKPALPIFLAAMLGFGSALLLDGLKTRRENRNVTRERLEKELAQLSGANTAIAFNIEALIHTVMQQILPHYTQSHAAAAAIEALQKSTPPQLEEFDRRLHSEFEPMMKRCPDPYFIDVDFFKDLSFLLLKDPQAIGLAGWIATYTRNLKAIIVERNRLIDHVTLGEPKEELDFLAIERAIATQATISDIEIVNSYQLLTSLRDASRKIETVIVEDYKKIAGAKLKIQLPPIFNAVLAELERLAKGVVPDWPPPEPNE